MSLELNYSVKQRRTFRQYIRDAYRMKYIRDRATSRFLFGSLLVFSFVAWIIVSRGVPTGLGIWLDGAIVSLLNVILLLVAVPIISFILSLLCIPLPRKLCSLVIIMFIQMVFIFQFAELDRWLGYSLAVVCTITPLLLSSWLLVIWQKWQTTTFIKMIGTIIPAIGLAILAVSTSWSMQPEGELWKQVEGFQSDSDADKAVITTALLDDAWYELASPSELQSYTFQRFSYGNGQDKHRKSFGEKVDYVSQTVDAENYITQWPRLKQWFWGFSPNELPLNGTVWMPEGKEDERFPVALIVHGNHLMEDFSDSGYSYLGEMLASQGIIAISVDQNFLNYSSWSGIVDNDMVMRAWMLLQHINQLIAWNNDSSHPLYAKFDLDDIALIGHSRGGQAAAMAVDRERFFADDTTLPSPDDYQIKAVVAMAPTDKQVDNEFADLQDVFYLTLQGARDADVNNFYGERQYARTILDTSHRFKAALYIADANHSQFNSAWGKFDERLPAGLFLNRTNMLTAEEQQQVAKVYIAAFLQAALLDNYSYTPLFQHYEHGAQWLPETHYISRYEDGSVIPIAKENGIVEKSYVTGMSDWDERTYAINRDGNSKQQEAIELAWDRAGAEYNMILTDQVAEQLEHSDADSIIFSLAIDPLNEEESAAETSPIEGNEQVDEGTAADNGRNRDEIDTALEDEPLLEVVEAPIVPQLEIEVETDEGEVLQLVVNDVTSIEAPVHTQFTKFSWLENRFKNNKYKHSAEAIFQTVIVPLEYFSLFETGLSKDSSLALNPAKISKISFRFASEAGKVFLADIGYINKEEANEKQF